MTIIMKEGDVALVFKPDGMVHAHIPQPDPSAEAKSNAPVNSVLVIAIMHKTMNDPTFVSGMLKYYEDVMAKRARKVEKEKKNKKSHLKLVE